MDDAVGLLVGPEFVSSGVDDRGGAGSATAADVAVAAAAAAAAVASTAAPGGTPVVRPTFPGSAAAKAEQETVAGVVAAGRARPASRGASTMKAPAAVTVAGLREEGVGRDEQAGAMRADEVSDFFFLQSGSFFSIFCSLFPFPPHTLLLILFL